MNKAERAALLQELKRTTGQINADGSPFIDDGEIADPKVLSRFSQPSREKIKALAERMARKPPTDQVKN
ncbi:MAG: hypothetical protein JHC81_06380 [Brevundimonas sp.]|uniref:hypothetical protein n=1 Tax=Brevundimonas sp. TaxID=1871086 RepID=UPI001A1BB321|nr:hypothetical protein [Brevundimonas sp.]MBJ7447145.1 hypothetical protein [Brevundimonas sp.]